MSIAKRTPARAPALAAAGLAFMVATLPAAATTPALADASWRFDVFLDDREIGYHEFRAAGVDGKLQLTSEARFEVKVFFVTAFDYTHRNTELWQDGCLERIEARTSTNGKQFEVVGRSVGDTFDLQTRDGEATLTDCVATFAYWDRDRLSRQRLLNSQTGEYVDVSMEPLPPGTVRIDDMDIPVERLRLSAKDMDITLAYAQETGEWVALDSTVKGGRILRYRREADDLTRGAAVAFGSRGAATGVFK